MNTNNFAEWLVETMLGWSHWLADMIWGSFGGGQSGFANWFSHSWVAIVIILIIAGMVVDWLIWMVRWRPYWLWFHKKQLIAEDVPAKRSRQIRMPSPHFYGTASRYEDPMEEDEYVDSFEPKTRAAAQDDPFIDDFAVSDEEDFWMEAQPNENHPIKKTVSGKKKPQNQRKKKADEEEWF